MRRIRMQKIIEIIVIYFFIELTFRILFQDNYRDIRYLVVFLTFLLFMIFLNYLSWKNVLTPLFYLYISLFIISLLFSDSISLLFQAVLFAPVIEEIICRQYIFEKIANTNLMLAFIVSILFFWVFHFPYSWQQSLYIVACGVVLCIIQVKTGKVGNPIALHGLINLYMIMIQGEI
ncbi:CPBP family intramembrane metalloprotease [Listeria monocytogenes]|nr:CPBP family intramembrane metalloprotease [Listeria monocytogenes]EAC8000772.1 CPBP family intramembrane metalloprotease [Listeria monocytogenes]EAD7292778.1 CPBP family intramembrane metalloprotease [Listeria monocytogenes]EAD9140543.1 CPBP family intramembrane metalloprotease [Listeria monocytogenes]MCM64599.1 CPBP family intramembrane metalloprotease [Listeria monocytogenes]